MELAEAFSLVGSATHRLSGWAALLSDSAVPAPSVDPDLALHLPVANAEERIGQVRYRARMVGNDLQAIADPPIGVRRQTDHGVLLTERLDEMIRVVHHAADYWAVVPAAIPGGGAILVTVNR